MRNNLMLMLVMSLQHSVPFGNAQGFSTGRDFPDQLKFGHGLSGVSGSGTEELGSGSGSSGDTNLEKDQQQGSGTEPSDDLVPDNNFGPGFCTLREYDFYECTDRIESDFNLLFQSYLYTRNDHRICKTNYMLKIHCAKELLQWKECPEVIDRYIPLFFTAKYMETMLNKSCPFDNDLMAGTPCFLRQSDHFFREGVKLSENHTITGQEDPYQTVHDHGESCQFLVERMQKEYIFAKERCGGKFATALCMFRRYWIGPRCFPLGTSKMCNYFEKGTKQISDADLSRNPTVVLYLPLFHTLFFYIEY